MIGLGRFVSWYDQSTNGVCGVGRSTGEWACEHVFVTSKGSAYSQFKRALELRNFLLAWTTAAELRKVPLADALALLLLALDQQPWRFETAADIVKRNYTMR